MPIVTKYICKKCGYETIASCGPSGITTSYINPYICEKKKEVVHVGGTSPYFGIKACFSKEPRPKVSEIYPKYPCCPECKDHALGDIWDEKTCPKCGEINKGEVIACED